MASAVRRPLSEHTTTRVHRQERTIRGKSGRSDLRDQPATNPCARSTAPARATVAASVRGMPFAVAASPHGLRLVSRSCVGVGRGTGQ